MKIRTSIVIAFMAFTLSSSLNGQQISTVREIYDFAVGDIFHISSSGFSNRAGYVTKEIIQITSKTYSSDSSSVSYHRFIQWGSCSNEYPEWIYGSFNDSVEYSGLDDLINGGVIDSVYSSPDLYNGRLINYNKSYPYLNSWQVYQFVAGCGVGLDQHETNSFYVQYGEVKTLVYFKKGDETWGDSLILGVDDKIDPISQQVEIFPNPTTGRLFIDLQKSEHGFDRLWMYSLQGELVMVKNIEERALNLFDVSGLNSGTYFLKLENGEDRYMQKVIKF
jgi:hypothetical protein